MASTKRHPFVMRYRTGGTRDGTIVAQDVDIIGDAGAYPYLSPRVLFAAACTASRAVPGANVRRVTPAPCSPTTCPPAPSAGSARCRCTFGYEPQMDGLAARLGLSPAGGARAQLPRQG